MESVGNNEPDTEKEGKQREKRGTRRQQRYKAKQKLLNLCELASALAVNVARPDEDVNDKAKTHVTVVSFYMCCWRICSIWFVISFKQNIEVSRAMKRKRELVTTTTASRTDRVTRSFSQLSIVQPGPPKEKKLRTTKSKNRSSKQQTRRTKAKKTRKGKKLPLPDYLNVPNRTFTKMFIAASEHVISTNQFNMVSRWLDTATNMQYIRKHTGLVDKLLYLQLQQSLWTVYFDIGTAEDGVWSSEVQEKMSRLVMNDSTSTNPLSFVTHYRMNIDDQIKKTEKEINEHLNHFDCVIGQSSPVQSVDLSVILKAFVRKGQHKLNAEFECKKRLLHFDCQDHRLTKAFFQLKPTKQQV